MSAAFGKLEAQVTQLNAQLAQMVALQNGVDPSGYERMTRVAAQNSKMFRNAAASTGMFEVQQLKLNRATDDYIKKLQKQQMSFRELAAQRRVAAAAFREQLAMEQMIVRQNQGGVIHGKNMLDVVYPKEISADLATAGQRLMFFNEQLKSGAHQMVNWGKNTQWAGRQLMVGFTMPIAAFGAAAAVMAYQVDKELTRIAKVYDTTATSGIARERELIAVRKESMETAINAAKAYGSAGVDTLNVQAELAATGLRAAELQGYTNEIMRISTLGELEYADAIKSAISLQSVFNMSTKELTESFDYMNAVENATSLQTKDFAAAIPIAAAPVKSFGGDIKDLGVLLTAMKERGIEATQGANAIKAAMQRLGRPSKQIQEEWKALTGTDITKIFDQSTSLIDLFQRIGEATKNLDNKERIKAFSGLFGTYQVTRMGALVDGMQDLANGTGQVAKAAELANANVSDLAKTAEQELAQQAESLSGRWDRAFQELRLQMVAIGEPFLEVAVVVVKAITTILDAFNGLPKWLKVIAAIAIGFGALAGPLVMLTGLFANLFGNGLKIIGAFLGRLAKLMGATQLMTTEQRAATLAAELNSTAMNKEASAAQMLTMELRKLTLAQAAANRAAREARVSDMVAGGMSRSGAYRQLADERRQALRQGGLMNSAGQSINVLTTGHRELEQKSKTINRNWKNIGVGMGGAALAGGILLMNSEGVVGQLAQMVFYASLLGPLLTPLGGLLFKGFAGAGGRMSTVFKNMRASIASAGSMTAAIGKGLKGVGSILGILARAIGPAGWVIGGLALIYGIWNKTKKSQEEAAAAHKKLLDTQLAASRALNNSQQMFAENTGKAVKEMQKLVQVGTIAYNKTPLQEVVDKYKGEAYDPERESFGSLLSENRELSGGEFGTSEFDQEAIYQFIMLQDKLGLTAKQAAKELQALALASGATFAEADDMVMNLLNNIGATKNMTHETRMEMLRMMEDRTIYGTFTMDTAGKSLFDPANAKEYVNTYMEYINLGLANAKNKVQFDQVLGGLQETIDRGYAGMFERLTEEQRDALASVGVESLAQYRDFLNLINTDVSKLDENQKAMYYGRYAEYAEMLANAPEVFQDAEGNQLGMEQVFDSGEAREFEAIVAQALADTYNLGGEFENLEQVLKDPVFTSQFQPVNDKTVNDFKSRIALMRNLMNQPEFVGGADDTTANREKARNALLREMRQLLAVNGVETGRINSLQAAYVQLVKLANGGLADTGNKLGQAASKAMTLGSALRSAFAGLSQADFVSVYQTGMQGVQQSIADDMRSDFDSRMNSALESRQAYWDQRADALNADLERQSRAMDARHEAAQHALDAKWEKRMDAAEAYWDRRVEVVDKAIEAEEKAEEKRQKMFDAEIARINKLNEAMNSSIDFNVALNEGNFDEAAKIRNDAAGKDAQTALERAAGAGANKSAKRVDKLEGRRDSIEKAREKALKALQKQQEAEQRALQKSQDAQRRHLEAVTAMRQEALQQQTEDDMEAQRTMWENRKESLEKTLETFMSFIGANEKQVKKWAKSLGLELDAFEKDTIDPKSKKWGSAFGEELRNGMRDAGLKLASDRMWTALGEGGAKLLLEGMGFKNMEEFRRFVKTGNFNEPEGKTPPDYHEGGFVGSSAPSRKGVARGVRGLHSSETYVRAQVGEYMVDRANAAKNAEALRAISSGVRLNSASNTGTGIGGNSGAAGLLAIAGNYGLMHGTGKAMKRAYRAARRPGAGVRVGDSGTVRGGFVSGSGGWSRPSVPGKGWRNSHDYGNGELSPLYAHADSTVVASHATTSGGSPGNGVFTAPNGLPYRSYGEVIKLRGPDGNVVTYAHLAPRQRYVGVGQKVKGGSLIGRSGWTGNATGPHTHFDINGDYNASGWFAAHGIGLKKGASEIKWDNTVANLHKGEAVLTEDLNRKFHEGVNNFANGGNSEYNVKVYVNEPGADADEIADKVILKLERREGRKPRGRRNT